MCLVLLSPWLLVTADYYTLNISIVMCTTYAYIRTHARIDQMIMMIVTILTIILILIIILLITTIILLNTIPITDRSATSTSTTEDGRGDARGSKRGARPARHHTL